MSVPRRWAPSWLVLPSTHRHLLGQPRGPSRARGRGPGRPNVNTYSHRASQHRIIWPRVETTRHRPPNMCPSWKLTLLYDAKRPFESNHHHPSLTRACSLPPFHRIRDRYRLSLLSVSLRVLYARTLTKTTRPTRVNVSHKIPLSKQSWNVSRVPATAKPSADE